MHVWDGLGHGDGGQEAGEHVVAAWSTARSWRACKVGGPPSEISILKSQIRGLASIGIKIDSAAGAQRDFSQVKRFCFEEAQFCGRNRKELDNGPPTKSCNSTYVYLGFMGAFLGHTQ